MPDPTPPVAERRPTQIVQFGEVRIDEYAWLRDREDPAVVGYLEQENAYTASLLAPHASLQQRVYEEIVAAIEETDVSAAVRFGPFWYYQRTYEGRSYPVHCRRPVGREDYPDLAAGDEQVVLDENELAEGHAFCSVGVLEVSPDHRLAAVGVDFDGDERHRLSFRALDGGEAPGEVLEGVGYDVAWTADGGGVCYLRMDDAWRPHELWHHRLGEDPARDQLLWREDDERFRLSVGRTRDDAAILVHVGSATTTEVLAADPLAPGALSVLWPRRDGVECSIDHLAAADGRAWWVAVTNEGAAKDFKVVAAQAAGALEYLEVVAAREGRRIERADCFATHVVLSLREGAEARVRRCALGEGVDPLSGLDERGEDVASDESPATTLLGANPEYAVSAIRVVQTSLVTPASDLDVDLLTGARTVRKRKPVRGGYDPARYVSARLWITARDGTSIPVSLVHRRDLLGDDAEPGAAPVAPMPLLLYGYGAYELCIDPTFSSSRLPLLNRGVAYAIAHVRGGGELGRSWYEQGRVEHKATTFHDFVDVARGLVERGYADPGRLAAWGGSAGGLLIGAAINEDPGAFRAAVAEVPFVDVLNTISDPSLPLTVGEWEEWGDPVHDEAAYKRMRSWSPYENVAATNADGTVRRYPELLVLGSLNDTRVSYWEPAKWVARLRAANPQNRVAFKTDLGAGHSGPSGRYDAWRERAMVYAFVLSVLGAGAA